MEVLWISGLILIFSVLDAIIYKKLQSRTESKINHLDSQERELQREYQDLAAEVQELKHEEQKLRQKKQTLQKKKQEAEESLRGQQKENPAASLEDMLLQEKIVTQEQLQKAKIFIQNNHTPINLLDAMIMLDIVDLETANRFRQNSQQQD